MDYARIAVTNGVEKLSDYFGNTDWIERINTDDLAMHSSTACILGQLFGEYETGLRNLDISHEDYMYGFSDWWDMGVGYGMMTNAWIDYLEEEGMNTRGTVVGKDTMLIRRNDFKILARAESVEALETAKEALDNAGVVYDVWVKEGA